LASFWFCFGFLKFFLWKSRKRRGTVLGPGHWRVGPWQLEGYKAHRQLSRKGEEQINIEKYKYDK
ncbi:hypothetical protein ACQP3L_38200, partial [Escherichia coli]